jgi:hypothetical protein
MGLSDRLHRWGWKRRHRRGRAALLVLGVVYLAVALYPGGEIFPFFSWKLFHARSGDTVRFSLILEEVKGKALVPPRNMLDVRGPARRLAAIDARALVKKLGSALRKGLPSADKHRELLESAFLGPLRPIRYRVVAEKYDPSVYLASRKITWTETLGAFELK